MEKKKYEIPQMEMLCFETKDVITQSNETEIVSDGF